MEYIIFIPDQDAEYSETPDTDLSVEVLRTDCMDLNGNGNYSQGYVCTTDEDLETIRSLHPQALVDVNGLWISIDECPED